MAPAAYQKRTSTDSRRRSSVFPKLVFYKGAFEHDDGDEIPYMGKFGAKNRRLSVENSRRVVKHLRGRLTSIKDRSASHRDIPEGDSSEEDFESKSSTKMFAAAPKLSGRKVLFSERNLNGIIHHYKTNKKCDFDNGVSSKSYTKLPTIIVEESERTTSPDDALSEEENKRPTTPGIFVDWKSDSESEDDGNDTEYGVRTNRRLWSSKRKNPREIGGLSSPEYEALEFLWDVNSDVTESTKMVKIFISSDKTMMRERQMLLTDVFPKLATLAGSLEMRLEMVDLSLNDSPQRKMLAQHHIQTAVKKSVGTSFLLLLSNDETYNQCTALPHIVPEDIMNKMMRKPVLEILACEAAIRKFTKMKNELNEDAEIDTTQATKKVRFLGDDETEFTENTEDYAHDHLKKRIRLSQKSLRILKKYYELDENAIPAHFKLKEQNRNPTHDKYLMKIFQRYIKIIDYEPSTNDWKNLNLRADTESDITLAFQLSSDPRKELLCFYRMVHKEPFAEESDKFVQMRDKIGYNNTRIYHINNDGMEKIHQGKDPKLKDSNTKYLEKFKSDAYNMISNQIRRKSEQQEKEQELQPEHKEIAHHLRFMQDSYRGFVGRENILRSLKKYILSDDDSIPVALIGEEGCGLSSIMGTAASKVNQWRNCGSTFPYINGVKKRQAIVIYRSVGVTGESTFVKELMFGICSQLRDIAIMLTTTSCADRSHEKRVPELTMGSVRHLAEQLIGLLIEVTENRADVFIFIDNMGSVSTTKERNIWGWIPSPLPKNVKVVVSLADNIKQAPHELERNHDIYGPAKSVLTRYKIFSVTNTRSRGKNGICQPVDTATSVAVLQSLFDKTSRTITDSQMQLLLQHLKFPASCLQLETLFHIAATWNSFATERLSRNSLKVWSSDEAVRTMLSILELNHEKTLYRSVLCFLSCSRNGLTQQETVDLVARDRNYIGNQVTNTTLKQSYNSNSRSTDKKTMRRHALKPHLSAASERCRSVFEINAYWYQLIQSIARLLMPCFVDDVTTLKWKHSAYSEAVRAMYMASSEELQYYHKIMSAYFSNIPEPCRCGKTHDCHQPLRWYGASISTGRINRRRLSESIYHAIRCNDLEHIKFEMLFNYEWLQAKLDATSVEFLMDEIYNVLLMKTDDCDIRLLLESLFLSYDILNNDPTQLPSQLIGRLNDVIERDVPLAPEDPRKYPHARVLLYHIRRSKSQYLMPTTTCLISGTQVIYDPMYGHEDTITAMACCTDGQRIATASKDSTIKIWDIVERRVLRTIPDVGGDISSLCLCMGNYYIASTHVNNNVRVWNIQKATKVMTIEEYASIGVIHCTVAVEGQLLAVISKMTASVRVWDLDKMALHKEVSIRPEKGKCPELSVARNCHATNVLIGYKNIDEAIVLNVRRGRIARTLSCENGRITQVEVSREYYIVGCLQRKMEVHELQDYYLFDTINYGLVRVLKACTEDNVSHIFVNRLGSHLIGISTNTNGAEEVVVWNMESDSHRHMAQSHKKMFGGVCTDLQYCMTVDENEWIVRIHNLAAQITKHDHSRTQVRKKINGIAKLYNMPKHDKYVVAQGTGGSPITIWNVARRKCRGKAVIIERGLLDKNDIIVVKDVMVVILSDRGMTSLKRQAFETIYVYNLLLRKYERKLHPVRVNICPPDHYHLLDDDKLLATSIDRTYMTMWSVVTGEVLHEIHPVFPTYRPKEEPKRPIRRRRGNRTRTPQSDTHTIKTNWKPCRVSPQEQRKAIYEMILSSDDSTLVCAYHARHMVIFDLKAGTHKHTITDKNSILHLNKAVINATGTFLLCTNYDNEVHTSYLTLWDLTNGVVARRKQDEPKVCSVAMTDDGSRIAFVTEDNLIKIWDPFRRQSHRTIAGDGKLNVKTQNEFQPATLFIVNGGKRAILFADSISVWDLDSESLLMMFEPDYKFACCTVALSGQVIVVGRRDFPSITTLRLPEDDDVKAIDEKNRFGEEESDSDNSLSESEGEDP